MFLRVLLGVFSCNFFSEGGWAGLIQKTQSLLCVVSERGKLTAGATQLSGSYHPISIPALCGPSSMVAQDWEASVLRDW